MKCGHRSVALLRYLDARDLAAPLAEHHHMHAQSLFGRLTDTEIRRLTIEALERSKLRRRGLHTETLGAAKLPEGNRELGGKDKHEF